MEVVTDWLAGQSGRDRGAAGRGRARGLGLAARWRPYTTGAHVPALTAAARAERVSIDDEPACDVMARVRFSMDDPTPPATSAV